VAAAAHDAGAPWRRPTGGARLPPLPLTPISAVIALPELTDDAMIAAVAVADDLALHT
jgi:hypothetical protein